MGKDNLGMNVGILTTEVIREHKLNVIQGILKQEKFTVNGVYIDCKKPLSIKEKLLKNIRRGRGFYTVVMMFNKHFKNNDKTYNVKEIFKRDITYFIENLYSDTTIKIFQDNAHDVLVLIDGYGIIKEPILSVAPNGILSYHHGNIRKYRGMPPLFWEFFHGEKECGATVQRLSKKLDAGEIMAETSVKIDYAKSFESNKQALYKKSEQLIIDALEKVLNDEDGSIPKTFGKVYTLPNFREWIFFILKSVKFKLLSGK